MAAPTTQNTVPSSASAVLTGNVFSQAWFRFFAGLIGPAAAASDLGTASQTSFTASVRGNVIVSGGVVSAVSFVRGKTTYALDPSQRVFPMSQSDQLSITFTTDATSIIFFPS